MTDVAPIARAFSLEDQIRCVKREIMMRESVYGHWVSVGRISQSKAADEIGTMRAVLSTLERLQEDERPRLFQ